MELAEIVARLREAGAEFEDVEVKRAAGGLPQSIAETMSAFANSKGGILILGLDERAGFAAVGVSDPVALRDELAGVARSKLTPPLAPGLPNYKLDTLLAHFAIKQPADRHRAYADVEVTAQVFFQLILLAGELPQFSDLAALVKTAGRTAKCNVPVQGQLFQT